jgi:hypothetical protein
MVSLPCPVYPREGSRKKQMQQFDFEKDFLFSGESIGKPILCVKEILVKKAQAQFRPLRT